MKSFVPKMFSRSRRNLGPLPAFFLFGGGEGAIVLLGLAFKFLFGLLMEPGLKGLFHQLAAGARFGGLREGVEFLNEVGAQSHVIFDLGEWVLVGIILFLFILPLVRG